LHSCARQNSAATAIAHAISHAFQTNVLASAQIARAKLMSLGQDFNKNIGIAFAQLACCWRSQRVHHRARGRPNESV